MQNTTTASLWLAQFASYDEDFDWFVFASPTGDKTKARAKFLQVYKADFDEAYTGSFRDVFLSEIDVVEDYKIKLVKCLNKY